MDVRDSVLASFDQTWSQLGDRLVGLGDAEHLWEPVAGCWTVRPTADGVRADWQDPDPVPPPLTTIAWRMWHLAVDALDSYSRGAFGTGGTGLLGRAWVLGATEAVALLEDAVTAFRTGVGALDDAGLARPLGPAWGDHAERSHLDLLLLASRELAHHGAEIALLRDLHRQRHGNGGPQAGTFLPEV